MNRLIKMAVIAAGACTMIGIAGCGSDTDPAKEAIKSELNRMGVDDVVFVSEQRDGDKCVFVVKMKVLGEEVGEEKIHCIKTNGVWAVDKSK